MAGDEVRKTGKVQFAEVWMLSAVSNRLISKTSNMKKFIIQPNRGAKAHGYRPGYVSCSTIAPRMKILSMLTPAFQGWILL